MELVLQELRSALEDDPLNNFAPLGTLARRQPSVVVAESLRPLQALLAFEPQRTGLPYVVWLWGSCQAVCLRLLNALPRGAVCYLWTPDKPAAEAAKAWAAMADSGSTYTRYTVTPELFRPAGRGPFEVRELTSDDAPLLVTARPHAAQALTSGLREPNRVFGAVDGGRWLGDVFCFPAHTDVWVIGNLFVDEEHRRRGIGKALVTAATEYVFERNGRPSYEAHAGNLPSRRTVEVLGYEATGRYYELGLTSPQGHA